MKKIILDCDPGHDDAIALLLAGSHPDIDLLAVTTVAGNVEVEKTTYNAQSILEYAGFRQIPVAAGAAKPLLREQITAAHIHGASGLSGADLPAPQQSLAEQHAVDVMIHEVAESDEPVTLVAVGPLTNVALALHKDPSMADNLAEIVIMGGGYRGNHTPTAEFNVFADPEAAKLVFDSGVPITLCPLELTKQSTASPEHIRKIERIGNRTADFTARLLWHADENYRRLFGHGGPALHDAVAVAYCIHSEVMTTLSARVDVELQGTYTYGMTVIDPDGKSSRTNNAAVGETLDSEAFWSLLYDAFRSFEGGQS